MDNVKYNLFCNAVLETSLEMIENDLKNCKEYASVSIKRTKQLNKAFDIKAHFRPSPKQFIAIFIAAALLFLTGCGIVYRDKVREFVINIYNEFVKITFSKENEKNKEFNAFEASYIPDGFEPNEETILPTFIKKKWINVDQSSFSISQYFVEDTVYNYDNNYLETKEFYVKDLKVLFLRYKTTKSFLWNDGKYAFILDVDDDFSNEEAEQIINGTIVAK